MTVSVAELDAMTEAGAAELLAACCGAQRWVSGMLTRRPFGTAAALRKAADLELGALAPEDWREAFAHHPRIGERSSDFPQPEPGQRWSVGEQRGMDGASVAVRSALTLVNQEYAARFGYSYIVYATGKSADAMLAIARARLGNDPDSELVLAAAEQQKITQRRLEALLR